MHHIFIVSEVYYNANRASVLCKYDEYWTEKEKLSFDSFSLVAFREMFKELLLSNLFSFF
jgi:hypothetical protein